MSQSNQLSQQATEVAQAIKSASSDSVALAVFSGLIAYSESFVTKSGLQALIQRNIPPAQMHEIVLQSYLFCGFPRMLDALFDLSASVEAETYITGDSPDSSHLAYSEEESKEYERRGRDLIRLIYGDRYGKLEEAITRMSPEVFRLMIMEGYGKTLSRSGLNTQTRELAVIAALTVDRRPRQLRAHLRGAKNVGVAPEALNELLQALGTFTSQEHISIAANMLAEVNAE